MNDGSFDALTRRPVRRSPIADARRTANEQHDSIRAFGRRHPRCPHMYCDLGASVTTRPARAYRSLRREASRRCPSRGRVAG